MDKIKEIIKSRHNLEIIKKLGSGSFGNVYKASNGNHNYAIKIEDTDKISRLEFELNMYKSIDSQLGIPKIFWYGEVDSKSVLIMEYLGPSLDDLFEFCGKKFSLKTVSMIALQILDRIKIIHDKNILHRDIKPDNFVIGSGKKKNVIYMIDLGLSKFYKKNQDHIVYKKNANFTGSFRYSSIRNHKGIEQSRRDDLESIGYMLIYFLLGRLPWQGLAGSTKSKRSNNIFNIKRNTSIDSLCKDLPKEFATYMKYCRLLRFRQRPDYNYLKSLFINIFNENNYKYDDNFDWNILAKSKKKIKKRIKLNH